MNNKYLCFFQEKFALGAAVLPPILGFFGEEAMCRKA